MDHTLHMHVLYFYQHFSTPAGSTGTRAYEMARVLISAGHQVSVVCGSVDTASTGVDGPVERGIRRGTVDGINVIEIVLPYSNYDGFTKRCFTFLRYAFRGIAIAATTKYDVLFATSTPLTAGIPGIAMRVLKPFRPFVFEVRDLWPELPKAMGVITNPLILFAMDILERTSYLCASRCIGLAPGICEGIAKKSFGDKPVDLIPNGCDTDLFLPIEASQRRKGPLRAVFTGTHGRANGLYAVLDAAQVLRRREEEDIELHFIGNGKEKPGLVERAKEEGLFNCVFHPSMPKSELAVLLPSYDVGLMVLDDVPAFYYGTSPNKFFDYISCGLPVLNNYPGWLAGMIGEHSCGRAVPPRDPEAFADALVALRDDPTERLKMGKASRELALTSFGRALLSSRFVACLEAVVK